MNSDLGQAFITSGGEGGAGRNHKGSWKCCEAVVVLEKP